MRRKYRHKNLFLGLFIPFIAALAAEASGNGHPAALSATHLERETPHNVDKAQSAVSVLDFQIMPTMCNSHMISHNWSELAGDFKG